MMPDLHVTLNVAAIEYDENLKSESKYLSLRKIFRARLADFHEEHRKVYTPFFFFFLDVLKGTLIFSWSVIH